MSERIHSAADYLELWRGICASSGDIELHRTYFHHAEQFFDGSRAYCRDRIAAQLRQHCVGGEPQKVLASCQSPVVAELDALCCCLELAGGGRLTALAEVARGRIKREWVQLQGAAATCPAGLHPELPETDGLCGFSGYRVPELGIEVLQSLQRTFSQSATSRLLVEHCVVAEGQVALLWQMPERQGDQYRSWQGISLYASRKGEMRLVSSNDQLPASAMPSAIRS